MNNFLEKLALLKNARYKSLLKGIQRGFEKESLRVNASDNTVSQKPHPFELGSSLTNPFITTDYSEALLELITPPSRDLNEPFENLHELHIFTNQFLKKEYLWSASMPSFLPSDEADIPIATYGTSFLGQLKHLYRQGLGYRYGRRMQMIAGIHYNFSLSPLFWETYYEDINATSSLKNFISEQYLGLIRNVLRMGWFLPLLFGASPAVEASFVKKNHLGLEPFLKDTYIAPHGTALRLSKLGYHNKTFEAGKISYNSFPAFLETMHRAVHTKVPEYHRYPHQLSENVFQIEDEHYSMIRPKRVSLSEERMLSALAKDGIEYIEIRALDVNPFHSLGIEKNLVYLIDVFLIYALLKDSPLLTETEEERIEDNFQKVVIMGRKMDLMLLDEQGQMRVLKDWGLSLLDEMLPIAEILDAAYSSIVFTHAIEIAKQYISSTTLLPSAQILNEMTLKGESWVDFGRSWSLKHQASFRQAVLKSARMDYYTRLVEESWVGQEVLEQKDPKETFDAYLERYLKA